MYYVYVLQSKLDRKLYIGSTSDLKLRIRQHNDGEVPSTRFLRPLTLIYYEAYGDKRDANFREKWLKTGWGRNYLKRFLKYTLRLKE